MVQQFSGKLDDSYCKKPKLPANPTSLDHKRYEVDTLAYQAMAELITSSKLDCGNVQAPILLGGQRGEADFTFTDAGELFMSSAKVKAKPESTLSLVSTYVRLHKELSNSYGSPSYVQSSPLIGTGWVALNTRSLWKVGGTLVELELNQTDSEGSVAALQPKLAIKHTYLPLACPREPRTYGCR